MFEAMQIQRPSDFHMGVRPKLMKSGIRAGTIRSAWTHPSLPAGIRPPGGLLAGGTGANEGQPGVKVCPSVGTSRGPFALADVLAGLRLCVDSLEAKSHRML